MLYVLKTNNAKLRKAILQNGNDDLIKTIIEIIFNTLNGNTKLKTKDQNLLKKYKKELRLISSSNGSVKSKRKVLVQKGGFLPVLLASLLGGFIGKLLENV